MSIQRIQNTRPYIYKRLDKDLPIRLLVVADNDDDCYILFLQIQ